MITPQEIDVWYILPALRREITNCMLVEGLKQKEIAKKLQVTEASVSQYLSHKRAKEVQFSDELLDKIKIAVDRILKESSCVMKELILLTKQCREVCCKIHKENPVERLGLHTQSNSSPSNGV